MDEWIPKKWFICTMEYYSALKRKEILIKKKKKNTFFPLPPGEDTVKRPLSINQEMGSHQTWNLLAP